MLFCKPQLAFYLKNYLICYYLLNKRFAKTYLNLEFFE